MNEIREIGPWAFAGLVTLIGAWLTYRASHRQTGVVLFEKLTTAYDKRLTDVERQLEHERTLRRVHRGWDDLVYDQARQAGWDVPPPPPLD